MAHRLGASAQFLGRVLESELPYRGQLSRLAHKILGPLANQYAEDVLQDTHLAAWRWTQENPSESVKDTRAWLYSIARNAAYDTLRRSARERDARKHMDGVSLSEPTVEDRLVMREKAAALLDRLNIRQRLVFEWVVIDGMTLTEAADILEISVPAVSQMLTRARRRMEE